MAGGGAGGAALAAGLPPDAFSSPRTLMSFQTTCKVLGSILCYAEELHVK